MVIQTPDAVGSSWLQSVSQDELADEFDVAEIIVSKLLQKPKEVYIRLHNSHHNRSLLSWRECIDLGQTSKKGEEAEFVSCSIIETLGTAEASK